MVCHEACQTKLMERLGCKRTFVEGARSYRDHPGAAMQSICSAQSSDYIRYQISAVEVMSG